MNNTMKKIFIYLSAIFVVANMSAQTRKVGDFIMVNGEMGVVFTVTADGQHGRVVSATQTNRPMCIVRDAQSADYWCNTLGDGWRLPTQSELKQIYVNKDTINITLRNNGYAELSEDRYWISEMFDGVVWFLHMSDGSVSSGVDIDSHCVRAVSAF